MSTHNLLPQALLLLEWAFCIQMFPHDTKLFSIFFHFLPLLIFFNFPIVMMYCSSHDAPTECRLPISDASKAFCLWSNFFHDFLFSLYIYPWCSYLIYINLWNHILSFQDFLFSPFIYPWCSHLSFINLWNHILIFQDFQFTLFIYPWCSHLFY